MLFRSGNHLWILTQSNICLYLKETPKLTGTWYIKVYSPFKLLYFKHLLRIGCYNKYLIVIFNQSDYQTISSNWGQNTICSICLIGIFIHIYYVFIHKLCMYKDRFNRDIKYEKNENSSNQYFLDDPPTIFDLIFFSDVWWMVRVDANI